MTNQVQTESREEVSEYELERQYLEMLNDCYEPVKICGYEYLAGNALKEVDPIAFDVGYADWISSELGETLEEIDGKYYRIEE